MEQAKKHLKNSSILVLIFAGFTLIRIVTELWLGEINSVQVPEGSPENILLITKLVLLAVSLLFLLPYVYVGIKGLRIAKNPVPAKGHIIWAGILLVLFVLELIDPAVAIIKGDNFSKNVSALASVLVETTILCEYIKHARTVAKLVKETDTNGATV